MIKSQVEVNTPLWLTVYFCILELASASVFSGGKRLLGDEDGLGLLRRQLWGPRFGPMLCSAFRSFTDSLCYQKKKRKKRKKKLKIECAMSFIDHLL